MNNEQSAINAQYSLITSDSLRAAHEFLPDSNKNTQRHYCSLHEAASGMKLNSF